MVNVFNYFGRSKMIAGNEFLLFYNEVFKEIDKRYVSRYERIKKAKAGLAVARISEQGACSGCFSVIPPQRIVEIRSKDQLFSCEHCGRILIWDETIEA